MYRALPVADRHVAFGHTMILYDLGGDLVTPPPCAASVPLPAELSKGIEDDIYRSSGIKGGQILVLTSLGPSHPDYVAPLANFYCRLWKTCAPLIYTHTHYVPPDPSRSKKLRRLS